MTRCRRVVYDDGQEGRIDREAAVKAAVVVDEAQLLELVHEEVHAGPRRPDHVGKCLLRHSRQRPLGLLPLAVAREQQQRAGQPSFGRVEQLIDKV